MGQKDFLGEWVYRFVRDPLKLNAASAGPDPISDVFEALER